MGLENAMEFLQRRSRIDEVLKDFHRDDRVE